MGRKLDFDDISWADDLDIPAEFQDKSARSLLADIVTPWVTLPCQDFDAGFQEVLRNDEISFRAFLRAQGWPHEVFEYVELMKSQTNQYNLSFTELIIQNLDFNTRIQYKAGCQTLSEPAQTWSARRIFTSTQLRTAI